MLSLPLIPPQDDNSTWLRTTFRPRSDSPPPANGQNPHHAHRLRQQREEEKKAYNARSPLALLEQDEASIMRRRSNIANFGATWIRPPGVPKTLQAMHEEEIERQEQLELERQEAGMRDMQAQQQLAEAQAEAEAQQAAAAEEEDAGEGEEEVDLDAEIPEGDVDVSNEEVTFNEDSLVEGSQLEETEQEGDEEVEMEEAELTGAARDEEDLGLERDLDDSVPEAGSYQHTDTEVEDTDSESELQNSFVGRTAPRAARTPMDRSPMMAPPQMGMGLQERMRAQVSAADALPRSPGSLNLSSSALDSSLVESSPVMQRSQAGARGRGGRARRGRQS